MNATDLRQQILKYKARRTKIRLAYYSAFISLALTLSIFTTGLTWTSLVAFIIVLPVPLYFCFESLKFVRKSRQFKARFAELQLRINLLESKFSLKNFLSQPNFTFRLSLFLFILLCLTTFARARQPDPSLTMNTPALTLSR